MAEVRSFEPGGYRFIRGVFQYSAGVAAQPGFQIQRARLRRAVPLAEGFAAIEDHLRKLRRPIMALCACELRLPAPLTENGFAAFNREYIQPLERWGIFREGVNPVARTNVCPAMGAPDNASFYAFSYTVPADDAPSTFVIAGSAEAPEGKGNYKDYAIRRGDQSPGGLREKARWVLGEMERRMAALDFDWRHTTATHLYTVYDIHPFFAEELVARNAVPGGLTWHFARPPVEELDYEMDLRGVATEVVI